MLALLGLEQASCFSIIGTRHGRKEEATFPRRSDPSLSMGLLDSISDFLTNRDGDFVKLEDNESVFGPGPLILMVNVPNGIDDAEIQDMVEDGAPTAHRAGCRLYRVSSEKDPLLDVSLEEALNQIAAQEDSIPAAAIEPVPEVRNPLLFFSGFRNQEMMAMYNILGQEIFEETQGQATPACAKAVANAMNKKLRQVVEEVSGDHDEAIRSQ